MSRKPQAPRFHELWVNQTELGRQFGISAVAVGKKLAECGLRDERREPSDYARREGYCRLTPMRDGTPFFLWNKNKVAERFRQAGLRQLDPQEVEAREKARELIALDKEARQTGVNKYVAFFLSEIVPKEYALIDRFLGELGSDIRLSEEAKGEARNVKALSGTHGAVS